MQLDEPATGPAGFTSELKFVVDAAVGRQIRDWARERLAADPHGGGAWADQYQVSSVYFDTGARDVFHRRGSYGRSKFRIRRYGQNAIVFLERKLRTGARLAKRRSTFDVASLPLLAGAALNGDGSAWFRRRVSLRGLRPVCQVSYTRIARTGDTLSGPVRLTLDEGLTALASDSFTFEADAGMPLLKDHAILELKYRGPLPLLFKEAVERFALNPRKCSKYRAAAEALGLVPPAVTDPRPVSHG
jgi:hypothetical protein